ncbi:hypothetical protein HPB49_007997 [Dermacentor silvarum]|uniref:Uncharacterized protein n=1 Tax=Dermacentor silvarum TaxID=543639 RepID=A0ACB8CW25_DERSI|nr:hypothetical protein HPB49_007997 [Dermacentor silvarum]
MHTRRHHSNTCKGVIRSTDVADGPAELEKNIANPRNPLTLAAKGTKNTGTVIITFDGHKVPNFVRYGPVLVRCSLYKKRVDVCYACCRLGHRADVCPSPEETICRGCGALHPTEEHKCQPTCELCGDPHPTGDKMRQQHYTTLYVVRRKRAIATDVNKEQDNSPLHLSTCEPKSQPPITEDKNDAQPKSRSHVRSRNHSRSREGSNGSTWVYKVQGPAIMNKTPPNNGTNKTRLAWADDARTGPGPMSTKRAAVESKLKNTQTQRK